MKSIIEYKNAGHRLSSIVRYVKDHNDIYNIENITEESVIKMIKANAKVTFDEKTLDSFRNIFKKNNRKYLDNAQRENIYRLCYSLGINCLDDANVFLSNYLGVNPLSPRVMEEYAIIAGYRLGLSWSDVNNAITTVISQYPKSIIASTRQIYLGGTEDLAREIDSSVNTVSDLTEFLVENCKNGYFAITRNTQYSAFFNCIDWSIYNPKYQNLESFVVSKYGLPYVTDMHNRLFGFVSEDDVDEDEDNPILSVEEIDSLAGIFPNAFLTYDSYISMLNRTRREQISSETLLIAIMNDSYAEKSEASLYEPGDLSYELWGSDGYLDFTDEEAFENGLNTFLANGGCALLNRNIGFDCLILDAHHDIVEKYRDEIMDGKLSNVDVKSLYYAYLRKCFREIIALPK